MQPQTPKPPHDSAVLTLQQARTRTNEASDDFDIIVKKSSDKTQSDLSRSPACMYFTEKDLSTIVQNLDTLRNDIFPNEFSEEDTESDAPDFPSVCLVGLGRCGSNIALDVTSLVHNARNYYLNEFNNGENISKEKDSAVARWLQRNFKLSPNNSVKPVFLMEPLVMLGDLDKDISGRIHCSAKDFENNLLTEYNKLKIMDLSEVHAGGSGNAPILGQYLAKMILNKETENFTNADWKYIHSYLIDSCGIKANQSRLYFYIFSAGGGTGSGMASEFGLAQQYSYMKKTNKIRSEKEMRLNYQSFVFEPVFTSGICILPTMNDPSINDPSMGMSEALHINAGRLLCKYLSEEWCFSYDIDQDGQRLEKDASPIRPWNAMMLISNDIMRYAAQSDIDGDIQNIDVHAMEAHANKYISQQIFNILSAQAVTTDYDENYFRRAGIDIGETIRLDANDLFMSLAGPVAIAYAESVVTDTAQTTEDKPASPESKQTELDIDDLFFRSIDLPHFNKHTQATEGVSLLPVEATHYQQALKQYKKNNYNPEQLKELHFFKNCSSVVSIVSLPKDYKLSYKDLNKLKMHLNHLFPNTTLKRYALVIGASENLSLTTLIAKSPCLSDDFLTFIVSYIKRCFAKEHCRFDDSLDKTIIELIQAPEFDEKKLDAMLTTHENPAKILDTNWQAIKPMYEKKYRELIRDEDMFTSINDLRLTIDCVKNAIHYLREIYAHKISKTKVISLSGKRSLRSVSTKNPSKATSKKDRL